MSYCFWDASLTPGRKEKMTIEVLYIICVLMMPFQVLVAFLNKAAYTKLILRLSYCQV